MAPYTYTHLHTHTNIHMSFSITLLLASSFAFSSFAFVISSSAFIVTASSSSRRSIECLTMYDSKLSRLWLSIPFWLILAMRPSRLFTCCPCGPAPASDGDISLEDMKLNTLSTADGWTGCGRVEQCE
uniref:Uncharacterized protein n=1 Tax=Palpitomonas bilix TaxID=652834 RepID=A0A7S3G9Q3_9EUKA